MSAQEDLFSRLVKHRFSERQRHVENFLSEILREFLNSLVRANARLHRLFVKELLLADCAGPTERLVRQIATARGQLDWKSQYSISSGQRRGQLDLVLFNTRSGLPLLVVEDKVNASPGVAAGESDDDDEEEDNEASENKKLDQLPFYGRWLQLRNRAGGLVYLTYATKRLPDFDQIGHGVRICGVALWVRIAEWLSTTGTTIKAPLALYLGKQLRAFLEGEGILQMEPDDVKLLERFFRSRAKLVGNKNRLEAAEAILVEALKKAKRELTTNELEWKMPRYHWGALVCSGELSKEPLIRLDYGFTSDTNGAWISAGKGGLVALVAVVVDSPETFDRLSMQLKQWGTEVPQDEADDWPFWYASCSVEELRRSHHGFTQAFVEWVRSKTTSARELVRAAMRNNRPRLKRRAKSLKRKPSGKGR